MKKKYTFIFLLILIICIGISAYLSYPKTDILSNFVSKEFKTENITEIEVRSTSVPNTHISLQNSEDIKSILSNLNKLKITEHFFDISKHDKGAYYISLYNNNGDSLEISIFGNKYISIFGSNYKSPKYYELSNINDTTYLDDLIPKNKGLHQTRV
ncbi:MAG: hypothetical protein E7207_07620 [Clostridium butyricum]|nr:hypothetical protein [Clostridium butyricum]